MKTCRKCELEKPLNGFPKDPQNRDGYKNVCTTCENRRKRNHYYLNREKRIAQSTEWNRKNKEKVAQYRRNRKIKNPQAKKAQDMVKYALATGKITKPEKCSVCKTAKPEEAHHEDYFKPLEVLWVCRFCHRELHRK